MLLLKGLKENSDIRFDTQLKASALSVADRAVLYQYVFFSPEANATASSKVAGENVLSPPVPAEGTSPVSAAEISGKCLLRFREMPAEVSGEMPAEVSGEMPAEVHEELSAEVSEKIPAEVHEEPAVEVPVETSGEIQEVPPAEVPEEMAAEAKGESPACGSRRNVFGANG